MLLLLLLFICKPILKQCLPEQMQMFTIYLREATKAPVMPFLKEIVHDNPANFKPWDTQILHYTFRYVF